MFFKKKKDELGVMHELDVMRVELLLHSYSKFAESSTRRLTDFTEKLVDSFENGVYIDEARFEQRRTESEQLLETYYQEIEQIRDTGDDDLKQLYYETFGRWHPVEQ